MHLKGMRRAGLIPPTVEDEELHLHGIHGLIDALHKYRPEVGSFKAYAGRRIRGIIGDYLRDIDAIPKKFRQEAKKMKAEAEAAKQSAVTEAPAQETPPPVPTDIPEPKED